MNPVTPADLERVAALFSGLPPDSLATLAGAASRRRLGNGETLFEQGQPAGTLYVVEEGSIVLRAEQDGRAVIVETLGPGKVVGWSAMRANAVTLSTGTASGPAQVIAIPVEPIVTLVTGGGPGARDLFQRIVGLAAGHLEDAWSQLLQEAREGIISGG
jgi:CRP-like cAMP-binding protein